MADTPIGVLGATSMVGRSLLPLLSNSGYRILAYSRQTHQSKGRVEYRRLVNTESASHTEHISDWICLAPIWTLPEHFKLLAACRIKRIVVLSSTSVFTKQDSSDQTERGTAEKLAHGENQLIAWAEANGVDWIILRPTLIYGKGLDRNIGEIARFIARFGFFPLLGKANGLRQPVHVEDIAMASMSALLRRQVRNHAYQLSGHERLSYREMVKRVFKAMGKPERFIGIPLLLFRVALLCLRVLPRFRHWSPAMAERMNTDLIFDHAEATSDFGFSPRLFQLEKSDVSRR